MLRFRVSQGRCKRRRTDKVSASTRLIGSPQMHELGPATLKRDIHDRQRSHSSPHVTGRHLDTRRRGYLTLIHSRGIHIRLPHEFGMKTAMTFITT